LGSLGLGLENKIETHVGPACFLTSRMSHMYNGVQIHNLQIPQDTKKSRALLQKYSKSPNDFIQKGPFIKKFLESVWTDLYRTTIVKGQTKYRFNNFPFIDRNVSSYLHITQSTNSPHYPNIQDPKFIQELIEAVKKEYEDCTVEYHETKGYDGKILEKVLVIDWS